MRTISVVNEKGGTDKTTAHDGPRISPVRRPRQTRKGLLVGTAAACLALGIWAMVRFSQNTPRAAAGADRGADNVTASNKRIQNNMGGPTGTSMDARGLTETPMSPTAVPAAMPAGLSMSEAPTTKPASDGAAALPAALAEQADRPRHAAVQPPTTRPAEAASESVRSPAGAGKAVAKADASLATRPTEAAFRVAPAGFSLGAVMRSPNGNLAVINGKPVGEGATVRGAKVIRIQPLSVELELDGQRFTVGLGRQASDLPPAATSKKTARK